jgi:hypothetical protein
MPHPHVAYLTSIPIWQICGSSVMAAASSNDLHTEEATDDVHPQAAFPNIQLFPVRHTKVQLVQLAHIPVLNHEP